MKRDIAIISLLILMITVIFVDRRELQTELLKLGQAIGSLEKSNRLLEKTIDGQNQKIETLQQLLQEKTFSNTDSGYWIAPTVAVVFLLGILFFIILKISHAPIRESKGSEPAQDADIEKTGHFDPESVNAIIGQIHEAREVIGAEIIKSGSDLKKQIDANLAAPHAVPDAPADHTLPLKVGLEIHRMRKRIENMPGDTKGLRALKNALKRMEVSFNDKGYEMTELLGKPFSEGMTVHARFVPSDELNPGEQIITKVITPQINFEGVLIQVAEVEVSIGDSDGFPLF